LCNADADRQETALLSWGMRVQDKVVVVAGGANGIGRARAVSLWPLTSNKKRLAESRSIGG
jgi:hypothetical protein